MAPFADIEDIAKLIPSLPLETRCPPFPLRQYGGFWLPEWVLPGINAVHTRFDPRQSDVFLASFPKSGTTWLKALAFATIHRVHHPPSSGESHPLRRSSPHDCVKFFESAFAFSSGDVFAAFPSPRILATHIPYSLLPETITANASGCRIVYICRDPKDTFVSMWLFTNKNRKVNGALTTEQSSLTIEEVFDLFCDGRCVVGPMWRHVIEYWEQSQRRPEKVLFLCYEKMLCDPSRHVKKLADFLGCPFSVEEEKGGVVDAIVDLCSFDKLKSLQANKNGVTDLAAKKESFFRKGVAGDWGNHISAEMAARLDGIVEDALEGSGFTFDAVDDAE
uniref:Sulfotransferase n=1 Tax=Leersia perrieri TaxID=77586 RepID=A0A0D9XSC2_9ORYZ